MQQYGVVGMWSCFQGWAWVDTLKQKEESERTLGMGMQRDEVNMLLRLTRGVIGNRFCAWINKTQSSMRRLLEFCGEWVFNWEFGQKKPQLCTNYQNKYELLGWSKKH